MKKNQYEKKIFILMTGLISGSICQAQQSKAMQDQQKAYDILHKKMADGRISTAAGTWTMTASINGKAWKANFMYGLKETGRIIGHYNEEFIGLPYKRSKTTAGDKISLGGMNGVDINLTDGVGLYGADSGEMIITKADGKWMEGTFHCIATSLSSSNKKLAITDGYFKVALQ